MGVDRVTHVRASGQLARKISEMENLRGNGEREKETPLSLYRHTPVFRPQPLTVPSTSGNNVDCRGLSESDKLKNMPLRRLKQRGRKPKNVLNEFRSEDLSG